jgi:hypothetical protein
MQSSAANKRSLAQLFTRLSSATKCRICGLESASRSLDRRLFGGLTRLERALARNPAARRCNHFLHETRLLTPIERTYMLASKSNPKLPPINRLKSISNRGPVRWCHYEPAHIAREARRTEDPRVLAAVPRQDKIPVEILAGGARLRLRRTSRAHHSSSMTSRSFSA